jgi:hypothetical protein
VPLKKNTLATIEEENPTIEEELKDLIESLDAPDRRSADFSNPS